MTATERRERQRAERHQLIITAARELAEAEGWEAVTTRKLADRVEYSQPVLYGHFANMEAIRDAVAIEGIGEMAARMRDARLAAPEAEAIRSICTSYLEFAAAHPAAYQAMFSLPTQVKWASDETPAPLRAAFNEIVSAFGPFNDRNAALAELIWGSLHGMAVLLRSGRIPQEAQGQRLDLLVALFANAPA
ncbi:TetR/AcrR family transcriptional regulator [Glycomyces sp. YM15]|uniref:TetR/AcrR family transcriptional regulator n=1 Tax=Glycomyces sp. YM15 TaxID=2800446 RepID=UPI001965B08E|nr:helix-turn-helix domain-containing protein [Glycomyces sp. YM15]